MLQTRQKLSKYLLISLLCGVGALAQTSTLSQIQDTVYTSTGLPFNGTVVITWTGTASSSGTAPFNTSVKISNGVLSVLLAPSTTITPTAYYQAVYNSNDGLTTWTETWAVPPSATPLSLSQVRVTNTSGSGGSGGTSSTGQVQISQVVGLASDLSAIDSSLSTFNSVAQGLNLLISNLTNTVNNLSSTISGTTTITTTANFVDAEIPGGTINGANTTFTLANTPASASDVNLYRNGVLLINGVDFTMSGANITFMSAAAPQTGDALMAYYRTTGTGPTASFVDGEIPAGSINGSNTSFSLANLPNPVLSLRLFKNGTLMEENVDYTLSSQTITFTSLSVPTSGDSLYAYYRTTSLSPSTSVGQGGFAPAQKDLKGHQQ